MPERTPSLLLVLMQLLLIGGILLTGPIVAGSLLLLAVEVLGGVVGVWSILAVGLKQVRITPEVPAGSRLVTGGPYRLVRHPMYTSVLLITLALVLDSSSLFRWAMWGALGIVLLVKLLYEEHLLISTFPEYRNYMKRTRRLIPFVW